MLKKKKKKKKKEKCDGFVGDLCSEGLFLLVECASFAGNKNSYDRRGIRHDLHHDI